MQHQASGQWFFVLDEAARLLVADDDPIFREFAVVHISSPAAEVVTACDGSDAWDKLKASPFDLALVDLEMPKIDGFELTQRIREDVSLSRLPIVVVTGREDIASIDRAFALGATSFVAKPVNWRLLSHQLKYVLRMDKIERQTRIDRDKSRLLSEQKSQLLAALTAETIQSLLSIQSVAQAILKSSDTNEKWDSSEQVRLIQTTAQEMVHRLGGVSDEIRSRTDGYLVGNSLAENSRESGLSYG